MDGLGVFDDGTVFLERGGGAVEQWFLDSGLMQDFGILEMNGIRAACRAVKILPPFILGGPSVLVPASTDECEDEAPERPHVCPECGGDFETLRQPVAHQTHKHGYMTPTWYRHSDQHMCMVSEQGSTCDLSSTGILHGKG